MTLGELIRKAREIGDQFNTYEIPLMHGDQECSFDLEVVAPRMPSDSWKIKIINYREE